MIKDIKVSSLHRNNPKIEFVFQDKIESQTDRLLAAQRIETLINKLQEIAEEIKNSEKPIEFDNAPQEVQSAINKFKPKKSKKPFSDTLLGGIINDCFDFVIDCNERQARKKFLK